MDAPTCVCLLSTPRGRVFFRHFRQPRRWRYRGRPVKALAACAVLVVDWGADSVADWGWETVFAIFNFLHPRLLTQQPHHSVWCHSLRPLLPRPLQRALPATNRVFLANRVRNHARADHQPFCWAMKHSCETCSNCQRAEIVVAFCFHHKKSLLPLAAKSS